MEAAAAQLPGYRISGAIAGMHQEHAQTAEEHPKPWKLDPLIPPSQHCSAARVWV